MKSLPTRLKEFCEFDDDATRDTAKHEDSDGYFGFISGADWQHARLKPVLDALVELAETQGKFCQKFSPGENWFPEMSNALAKLERLLNEMEKK